MTVSPGTTLERPTTQTPVETPVETPMPPVRPPARRPSPRRRRGLITTLVVIVLGVLAGLVGVWLWQGGDEVPSTHDSGIELILRERAVAPRPSTYDSGIAQALRAGPVTAYDSGIAQAVRERAAIATYDSGIARELRDRDGVLDRYESGVASRLHERPTTSQPSDHDSGIELLRP